MRKYILYELGVHSELPLRAAPVEECPEDVRIRWANGTRPGRVASRRVVEEWGDEIFLAWPRMARLLVRGGREIVVERGPDAEDDHLMHLVGQLCLGLLLHQRGLCTLHASATSVHGRAVLFAGPKGAGKSTLAAAMRERGHPVLTDDVAAIRVSREETPVLLPGMPTLNLWPDAAAHLGEDVSSWPPIWPRLVKRVHHLEEQPSGPVPVGCLLVVRPVADLERPVLEGPLSVAEAFTELVRQSHAYRLLEDPASLPRFTRQCARIVGSVPVVRMRRPASLDALPAVVDAVEELVEALSAPVPVASS